MFEKEVKQEARWPDASATVRMFDMVAMNDFARAFNPLPGSTKIPIPGPELLSLFKRALVKWENIPLLDGSTLSGEDKSDPKLNYVDMNFAFFVVVEAANYSELQEDELKNS